MLTRMQNHHLAAIEQKVIKNLPLEHLPQAWLAGARSIWVSHHLITHKNTVRHAINNYSHCISIHKVFGIDESVLY